MPTISILINNYNNGPWLRACVDSALGQTRPADEVIVYDDGSDDDSVAILRSYGDRIVLLEGGRDHPEWAPRQRQGRAIEAAFYQSKGEQVHLLDGDDAYEPGRLAAYAEAWAGTPEAVMVQAPLLIMDDAGKVNGMMRGKAGKPADWEHFYYGLGETNLFYSTSGLAFQRDYLARRLPFDFSDGINVWADTRLSLPSVWCGPVVTLDQAQARYRVLSGSASAREGTRSQGVIFQLHRQYFDRVASEFGRARLPVWKNHRHWRGVVRAALPARWREWIGCWLARRYRAKNIPATRPPLS